MIEVGQKVRFMPYWAENKHSNSKTKEAKTVTGVVTMVNIKHRFFRCEYDEYGVKQVETFKLQDIGNTVWRA